MSVSATQKGTLGYIAWDMQKTKQAPSPTKVPLAPNATEDAPYPNEGQNKRPNDDQNEDPNEDQNEDPNEDPKEHQNDDPNENENTHKNEDQNEGEKRRLIVVKKPIAPVLVSLESLKLPWKFKTLRPYIKAVGAFPTFVPISEKINALNILNVPNEHDFLIGGSTLSFLCSNNQKGYMAMLTERGIAIVKTRKYLCDFNSHGLQLERMLTGDTLGARSNLPWIRHESVNELNIGDQRLVAFTECDAIDCNGNNVEIKKLNRSNTLPKLKTFMQILSSNSYVVQGTESDGFLREVRKISIEELRPTNYDEMLSCIVANLHALKNIVTVPGVEYNIKTVNFQVLAENQHNPSVFR